MKNASQSSNDQILGNTRVPIQTRSSIYNIYANLAFSLKLSPEFKETESDENWIFAIQEEVKQFSKTKEWSLAPSPNDHLVIKIKCVYKNELVEAGIIIREKKKPDLWPRVFNKEEGIDYDETFAPWLVEAIRILLALHFKLYQMYVYSAVFNGYIMEEIYIE